MGKVKLKMTLISIVIILIVSALVVTTYKKEKTFEDLLSTDISNITEITMTSNKSGEVVTTTDKAKINKLISLLKDKKYVKGYFPSFKSENSYSFNFYDGDVRVLNIVGYGKRLKINNAYYKVYSTIQNKDIDAWFKSLQ